MRISYYPIICILLYILFLPGCSSFISSATVDMADNLSHSILNNNDLKTVETGAPAYLLMIDSMLIQEPKNKYMLCSGAMLYTAYTDVFIKDKERAQRLTDKAMQYALRAICVQKPSACSLRDSTFQEFETVITDMNVKDVPALYTLGTAWASWIQVRREDWNAIAEISRVEAIMEQVVRLDESHQNGGAHLYLGVLNTILPPAMGGKPEKGREHFERAMALSDQKNLMINVIYARQYARLMFDRELHDQLLQTVLKAEPSVSGYVLGNTLAQEQAKELLESAEDYF